MTRLRIAPEAEQELAEAVAWYEERRGGLGVELIAVIDRELEAIREKPLANPLWRHDRPYRKRAAKRFPYVIFFRVETDEIVISAIAHTRRAPGYWLQRPPGTDTLVHARSIRVLYTGPGLAGVRTSMLYLARTNGIALGRYSSRQEFKTMHDGVALTVCSDIRSSYFFESSLAGLAMAQRADADAHARSLKPLFEAHLDFLRAIDGVVFVVDSQVERREANLEQLERLRVDLDAVGRRDVELPVVFQLNKRDCSSASAVTALERELRWPCCAYVPSTAKTGEGVVNALRTLLAMSAKGTAAK